MQQNRVIISAKRQSAKNVFGERGSIRYVRMYRKAPTLALTGNDRCGGAFYTFVPQTAKGWQPVLLGTNCQPFFVAYTALQGHLVYRESRAELPHAAAVCCTKVSHTRLWFQRRVPRNPGAVSLDSSGAKGRRSGRGPRRKKPPPSGREGGGKRVWSGGYN